MFTAVDGYESPILLSATTTSSDGTDVVGPLQPDSSAMLSTYTTSADTTTGSLADQTATAYMGSMPDAGFGLNDLSGSTMIAGTELGPIMSPYNTQINGAATGFSTTAMNSQTNFYRTTRTTLVTDRTDGTPVTPLSLPNTNDGVFQQIMLALDGYRGDQIQDVILEVGVLCTAITPRDIDNSTSAPQGNHVTVPIATMPDDHLVGTTGAGPCIGLIVSDGTNIHAFHFEGGDNVGSTLASTLSNLGPNAQAAICGGDGELVSEHILAQVQTFLEAHPAINVSGFSNTSGLWLNAVGTFSVTPVEAALPDDNLPPPPVVNTPWIRPDDTSVFHIFP